MNVDLELQMKMLRRELRLFLLHQFRWGHKATKATNNMRGTMNKNVLSIRTAQHCPHRFKNGSFELNNLPHTGRPLQADMSFLKQLIEEDPRLTTWYLTEQLGCFHTAAKTHLHKLGKAEFRSHMNYYLIR